MQSNTRNTVQKEIIMDEFRSLKNHPTAEMVYDKVHKLYPFISKATVYRVLNQFSNENKIQKVRIIGGADRYDFNLSQHYHIVCTDCGNVYDIDFPEIIELKNIKTQIDDFKITGVNVCFTGLCPKCLIKEEKHEI